MWRVDADLGGSVKSIQEGWVLVLMDDLKFDLVVAR